MFRFCFNETLKPLNEMWKKHKYRPEIPLGAASHHGSNQAVALHGSDRWPGGEGDDNP